MRLAKIPAWYAQQLVIGKNVEPADWVVWCEIKDDRGWRRFHDVDEIDEHVEDWIALGEWAEKMAAYNIGFLETFELHRIRSSYDGVTAMQLDPIFHSIMSAGYATMHELRTVYSLEDAYLMMDSIVTTRVNEKIAIDAEKAKAATK